MKYMTFIRHSEKLRSEKVPQALYDAMGKFVQDSLKSGVLVETGGLKDSKHGTRIRLAGGKMTVTDGPFAESKEIVGGYAILKVKSKEEAIEVGRQFMELHRIHWPGFDGESELRPMEEYEPASS